MCAIERSYPEVGMGQILNLEYFSGYILFKTLMQNLNMGVNEKV